MITVEKMSEGVRREGLSYGLPMVFLKLGPGDSYPSTDKLVREILMQAGCRWICLYGENTTQVGMGTVIKGLSSLGLYTEVEVDGSVRDPGWLHAVDRWVVDYRENALFNFNALRSVDAARFAVRDGKDLSLARKGFEELKLFPGTKYIRLSNQNMEDEAFQLVRKYERARLYHIG